MKKLVYRLMLVSFLSVAIQSMEPKEEKYYCLTLEGYYKDAYIKEKKPRENTFRIGVLLPVSLGKEIADDFKALWKKKISIGSIVNLYFLNEESDFIIEGNNHMIRLLKDIKESTEEEGIKMLRGRYASIYKVEDNKGLLQATLITKDTESPFSVFPTIELRNNTNHPQKKGMSIRNIVSEYWWVCIIFLLCATGSLLYFYLSDKSNPSSKKRIHSPKKRKKSVSHSS